MTSPWAPSWAVSDCARTGGFECHRSLLFAAVKPCACRVRLRRFRALGCGGIIPLQLDIVLKRAQYFVGPNDNFVACFQAAGDFDVCRAGDAGGDRDKLRLQLTAMERSTKTPWVPGS